LSPSARTTARRPEPRHTIHLKLLVSLVVVIALPGGIGGGWQLVAGCVRQSPLVSLGHS
jgi:hypothetical protein